MDATAANDSNPLGMFRMGFAIAIDGANGCATGGKEGKEGKGGEVGMTCIIGVVGGCDVSIVKLVFSVFSSAVGML